MFIIVGYNKTLLRSTDCTTWAACNASSDSTRGSYYSDIAYVNGSFIVVGNTTIMTSTDGITWTSHPSTSSTYLLEVAYGNGILVAVGANVSLDSHTVVYSYMIQTSTDGVVWTQRSGGTVDNLELTSVTYGNGIFIAGNTGKNTLLISRDGISWTKDSAGSPSTTFSNITYGNGMFIAAVDSAGIGLIKTSTDGRIWTTRFIDTGYNYFDKARYINGLFVIMGTGGTILTSPDGFNWTTRSSGTRERINSATYGNGTYVVVGSNGIILTSDTATIATAIQPSSSLKTVRSTLDFFGKSVRYTISKNASVVLNIYDLRGRCIKTLVNNSLQAAGKYTVSFPRGMANGSYILLLKAGDYTASRTVVVQK